MQFSKLVSSLPEKNGAIHFLERGAPAQRSYKTFYEDICKARAQLIGWGVGPGIRVGIYAPNSYSWLVHDLALIDIGAISVPFTDDFSDSINDGLLDKYSIGLLLLSKSTARLFPNRPAHVALIDGENAVVQVRSRPPSIEPDTDDQHSLVFSSGSAGGLKGLVISRNGVASTLPPIIEALGIAGGDRLILFLPLSNFQQRYLCYAALWYDFDIILTEYTQLFLAIEKLNPSVLLAPPVFFQMMHAEFLKFPLFKRVLWKVLGHVIDLVPISSTRSRLARQFFPEFYRQFGNNIRMLITGMAPIRRNIGQFFSLMQLPLCEAYGMVEAGVIAFRPGNCRMHGSVGKPVRGVNLSFDSEGEIVVTRENPLTLRYFQCAKDENERTFVGRNTIATGDIGRVDGDGNLYLLGRKRETIVTSGGIKINPEAIEEEINNCADVANAVVFWQPDTAQLSCVVELNDLEDQEARSRVQTLANNLKTTRKLRQPMTAVFATEHFSKENGMLRPNMKIDRRQIVARYGTDLRPNSVSR